MDKGERLVILYRRLLKGEILKKADLAKEFQITERSVHRDIGSLKNVLYETSVDKTNCESIIYDSAIKGYRLDNGEQFMLTAEELLGVGKILLDSRGLEKQVLEKILKKLISYHIAGDDQKDINALLNSEKFFYIEPRHYAKAPEGKNVLEDVKTIGKAILQQKYITIGYMRSKDKKIVERRIKPVGICFSEYYFYMVGYIDDEMIKAKQAVPFDPYPTIYRIDRMTHIDVEKERYEIRTTSDKFKEGEFKKRI